MTLTVGPATIIAITRGNRSARSIPPRQKFPLALISSRRVAHSRFHLSSLLFPARYLHHNPVECGPRDEKGTVAVKIPGGGNYFSGGQFASGEIAARN